MTQEAADFRTGSPQNRAPRVRQILYVPLPVFVAVFCHSRCRTKQSRRLNKCLDAEQNRTMPNTTGQYSALFGLSEAYNEGIKGFPWIL